MDRELFRALTGMGFVLLVCRAQCCGRVVEGLPFLLSDVLCLRWGAGGKWESVKDY